MKFERVKSNRKLLICITIFLIVGVTIAFTISFAAYKQTSTIKITEGTVNYIIPDMKIVAIHLENGVDSEGNKTYESADEIPTSGYYLNYDDSKCYINHDQPLNVTMSYDGYDISIDGISKKNTKCYIYFNKYPEDSLTINDIITNSTMGSGTPDFTKTSCSSGCDEATVGLYRHNNSNIYYYRGDVTDNYVKFNGYYWRIIRTNSNGSL